MEKVEIRAFIKYFCKKGMPQSLKGGEGALRMMDSLAAPKMPSLIKKKCQGHAHPGYVSKEERPAKHS